jgi:hypothetical protein
MAKVNIDGKEYTLSSDKVQELMQWLLTNGAVSLESTGNQDFGGKQLLNETTPPGKGGPLNKATGLDPDRKKQDPDKTWDLGTKWI